MYSIVAALDWNYNVNRPGKISKDGKQLYKSKVMILPVILKSSCTKQVNRDGKKTTVVQVKIAKNYEYQDLIFDECLRCLENDTIPEVKVRFTF